MGNACTDASTWECNYYGCCDGIYYTYYYRGNTYYNCCNVSLWRFWVAMMWISIICCVFACVFAGIRAKKRR